MSWNNSLYTNVGTKMMSEVLSGATMTITKAVGGSGTTAAESLAALTDVKEQKQTLKILGIEDATDSSDDDVGKRIKIQITNGDLETGYILHQVGIYAKLADGEETLLIIMQDDRGVEIPSHTENSDFSIELYGIMAISNLANISVTVDPNAVASVKMVNQQIAQVNTKIDKAKEDLQKEAQETYLPLTGGELKGPLVMPGAALPLVLRTTPQRTTWSIAARHWAPASRASSGQPSRRARSKTCTLETTGLSAAWTTSSPRLITGISAAIRPAIPITP